MINSSLAFIASMLVQGPNPPPPVPKNFPPPPVGDVPLDGHLIILMGVAIILGIVVVLRNAKVSKSL